MSLEGSQKQHSTGGSANLSERLTLNEISRFFYLPLADAASNLGVCASALKKICRSNGLVRWPYRKVISGKSIEEIKRDASEAMSPAAAETVVGAHLQDGSMNTVKDTSKWQQGVPISDHLLPQQGGGLSHTGRQHARGIPSYLDEFKQGFPTNGLSSVSMRWWGNTHPDDTEGMSDEESMGIGAEKKQHSELLNDAEMKEEKREGEAEKDVIEPQEAALLSAVRKRAAEEGREAVKLSVARGHGAYKIRRKERLLLTRVFQSPYPSLWG